MKRRTALKTFLTGAAGFAASPSLLASSFSEKDARGGLKGNINHSVCKWTYDFLTLESLCLQVREIGFGAIDLCGPKDWPVLKEHNIDCSMCNGAELNLVDGWNHTEFHETLSDRYTRQIELVSKAGYKNLICFSGNRYGMDDETGLKNMTAGIKKIIGLAEQKGVTLQIEVFNSKVDHKDYMADNTKWAIELCKRIGSPNFKILYDIYHMQIDEGDIIHTIRENHQYFGHYHTAGVPGRHEIDESQELNYPAIMKAILATGYTGYVAQEFIPTGDTPEMKINSLRKAVNICDI